MASRRFLITLGCAYTPNNNPPFGTLLYSSCESNGFNFTFVNYFADGNGGSYSEDTGSPCGEV